MKIRIKKDYGYSTHKPTKGEIRRYHSYKKLLNAAFKNINEDLKNKYNVTIPITIGEIFKDQSVAALCYPDRISFTLPKRVSDINLKSLTWLLSHEISHWVLGHGDTTTNENFISNENEAMEFGKLNGHPWYSSCKFMGAGDK